MDSSSTQERKGNEHRDTATMQVRINCPSLTLPQSPLLLVIVNVVQDAKDTQEKIDEVQVKADST